MLRSTEYPRTAERPADDSADGSTAPFAGTPRAISIAWLLASAVLIFGSVACRTNRGPDWDERSVRAAGLQDEGELNEAEDEYEQLLSEAEPGSRDARYIHTKLAEIAIERGKYDAAVRRYRKAWKGHSDEIAAAARYDVGVVYEKHLERPSRAVETWFAVIRAYPNSANAEKAAETLARRYARRKSPGEFARRARKLHPQITDALGADNLLFWVAQSYQLSSDNHSSQRIASSWYEFLITRHPEASMADDAHWELANFCSKIQDWACALDHYELLAQMYRPSWLVGSYSSPYASRSRYQLGRIHLLFTDDYGAAVSHFQTYLDKFPTLRYADESAWHLAHIARLRGEQQAYRQRLRRFIDEHPKSRYVRRARLLLERDSSTKRHTNRD